jgi:hypothetical protein
MTVVGCWTRATHKPIDVDGSDGRGVGAGGLSAVRARRFSDRARQHEQGDDAYQPAQHWA